MRSFARPGTGYVYAENTIRINSSIRSMNQHNMLQLAKGYIPLPIACHAVYHRHDTTEFTGSGVDEYAVKAAK